MARSLMTHTVVGRALAVLEVVAECGTDITLAELARVDRHIPKPSTLRVASNLVARRLLRRTTHGYALGSRAEVGWAKSQRCNEISTATCRCFRNYTPPTVGLRG